MADLESRPGVVGQDGGGDGNDCGRGDGTSERRRLLLNPRDLRVTANCQMAQWLAVNVHNNFVGHAIRLAQAVARALLLCAVVSVSGYGGWSFRWSVRMGMSSRGRIKELASTV